MPPKRKAAAAPNAMASKKPSAPRKSVPDDARVYEVDDADDTSYPSTSSSKTSVSSVGEKSSLA